MITDVVAALIWDGDRFLACQRPAHKARGLLWEFVGGKVEPGETFQDALIRECREELAVEVRVGEVFMTLIHEYPDMTVRLTLFNASICSGTIRMLEHNDIRWITTAQIDDYSFCPADVEILEKLKTIQNGLQAELVSLADDDYRSFQCALMPTVDKRRVLGVRMPKLRQLAKKLPFNFQTNNFFQALPHKYYEEDNLHGILLSDIKDYDEVIDELDRFLPFIDNWATCDLIAPVALRHCPNGLIEKVKLWLMSESIYTVRFAIGVLMRYYLDESFTEEYLTIVAAVKSEEYYVNMMIAWYFATALAKQYDSAVCVLENRILPRWIHNKTIQKAIESFRISEDRKAYLRTLRMR